MIRRIQRSVQIISCVIRSCQNHFRAIARGRKLVQYQVGRSGNPVADGLITAVSVCDVGNKLAGIAVFFPYIQDISRVPRL